MTVNNQRSRHVVACLYPKWTVLRLQDYPPHQAPGGRLFDRAAGELVPFPGIQRHHPLAAGMVDVPPGRAAEGGDRCAEGVLEGTAFQRRIDAGMRNRASEIAG
jgi:hypothetical protein